MRTAVDMPAESLLPALAMHPAPTLPPRPDVDLGTRLRGVRSVVTVFKVATIQ